MRVISLAAYSPRYVLIASILWVIFSVDVWASLRPVVLEQQNLSINGTDYSVKVPTGYQLELLTADLDQPRMLRFSDNGDLFIGSKSGAIYRLMPPYTTPSTLIHLSSYPHSVAFRSGEILIARHDGLYHAKYQPGQKRIVATAVSLVLDLPAGGGHNSRTVAVGPDGRVYVSLGIRGNCSDEYLSDEYDFDRRRGGILVLVEETGMKPRWSTYASGLRNPVGFAWQPETGDMYASNNGPDHLGFDQPPEYFSRIDPQSFHGMPWYQFNGDVVARDHCIDSPAPAAKTAVTKPVATFPARNAPMAIDFVRSGAMDQRLSGDAIVALHGSWGTQPKGGFWGDPASRREPRLVAVRFDDGSAQGVDDLVSGFQLKNGDRWARPVGVAIGPDGMLYFTSDAGVNGLFRLKPTKVQAH